MVIDLFPKLNKAHLYSKEVSQLSYSQLVVFLDIHFNDNVTVDPLYDDYFESFSIDGNGYKVLTLEAINLLKKTPIVSLQFLQPQDTCFRYGFVKNYFTDGLELHAI